MSIESINPATGEQLASYEELTGAEVEAALERSQSAFEEWRRRPVAERAALFGKLAETLRANSEELADLVTLEMGKILGESKGEVEKCAVFCDHIAEHGEEMLAPRQIEGGQDENYVRLEPLGTILAVMPWNFPYVQVFRFAPAALMAGNVARAEARFERAAVRAGDRADLRRGGLPRGRLPDPAGRSPARSRRSSPTAGSAASP